MNINRRARGRNDCHRGCKQPLHVFQLTGINRSNWIRDDRGLLIRIKCNINKQGRKKNKDERKSVKHNTQLDVLRKCKNNRIMNTKFRINKIPPESVSVTQIKNFIFVNKYRLCFYLNQIMHNCISQPYLFI